MKKLEIEKTNLKTPNGQLENFFHTTQLPGGVTQYYPLSHFGTERAANQRAVHFILQKLGIEEGETIPDRVPAKYIERLGNDVPPLSTQKVHLYMKHPLELYDLGRHGMHQYWAWFVKNYTPKSKYLSHDEWMELSGLGPFEMRYKKMLTEFIFIDPFVHSKEELVQELRSERLFKPEEWDHDPTPRTTYPAFLKPVLDSAKKIPFELASHVALQRMIRFLEGEGYDGFKYANAFEDKGKPSYIIFRPQQVFNVLIPEQVHYMENPDPAGVDFLFSQEKKFFASRGVLSPTERILQSKKQQSYTR